MPWKNKAMMEQYNIDNRLQAVAAAVREGAVVADIGTDHGYLVCYLVGTGQCPRGFACDINEKPLAVAAQTIVRHGLSDRIRTIRTDGLVGLPHAELDDIVLAGMGGDLIGNILTSVPWTRDAAKQFVLQPMTKAEHLRRLLAREGFAIQKETAAQSARFAYTVMQVRYTGQCREIDALSAWTGMLDAAEPATRAYLTRIEARLQQKAAGLAGSRQLSDEAADYAALAQAVRRRIHAE